MPSFRFSPKNHRNACHPENLSKFKKVHILSRFLRCHPDRIIYRPSFRTRVLKLTAGQWLEISAVAFRPRIWVVSGPDTALAGAGSKHVLLLWKKADVIELFIRCMCASIQNSARICMCRHIQISLRSRAILSRFWYHGTALAGAWYEFVQILWNTDGYTA